jgi:L-2-hydroxyglutarate oxidase
MDVAVVGGGLVGAATALHLTRAGLDVTVFEEAQGPGAGQSGHNSNVIHSGAFYEPGSLKAEMALRGRAQLERFIQENGLPIERIGKLVVQQHGESRRFDRLVGRATANGVAHTVLGSPTAIREVEPLAAGERALWLPDVAITDFVAVLEALTDAVSLGGGQVEYQCPCRIEDGRLLANDRYIDARHVVVAAGVGFNRLCRDHTWRIVGFRGSYRRIRSPRPTHLIYAVPDPRYPFLGVHVTPSLDGTITAGPNAMLAAPVAVGRTAALTGRNVRAGVTEITSLLLPGTMQRKVQNYLPGAQLDRAMVKTGVRAQAVDRFGRWADDFVIAREPGVTFVANAPSPGELAG